GAGGARGGWYVRSTAAAQTEEDRAQTHHRTAARPGRRAAGATGAAVCAAIPGAAAEQHLPALISHLRLIDRRIIKCAGIINVLYDCHYRPAQCRKIDAVQSAGRAEACAGRS